MSYLTQSEGELWAAVIDGLEGEGFAFDPLTTTMPAYLATCLGEVNAHRTKSVAQMLAELNTSYGGSLSHLTSSVAHLMDDLAANIAAGGGDPELEELAFADFVNGVYRKAGVAAVVGDIVVQDAGADWGSFNPATHITVEGLVTGQPVVAAALETTLLTSGFTAVIEYMPRSTSGSVQIDAYDSPDYTKEWVATVAYDEDEDATPSSSVSAAGSTTLLTPVPDKDALIKFAVTIAPDHVSVSVNGGAVQTATTAEPAIYNNIGISPNTGGSGASAIRTMKFHPPQADAVLPALST